MRLQGARQTLFQIATYGALGIVGTVAHYAVLLSSVEFFQFDAVIATSMGFTCGALINHSLQRSILFKQTTRRRRHSIPRFFLVASLGMVINGLVLHFLISLYSINYMVAQIMATATVFSFTFLLNKKWTFNV